MTYFNNPGLEGNPHFTDVTCLDQPGDQQIAAILTLAYEQRTATLVALLAAGYDGAVINGLDYNALADQIVTRLQPINKEGK